MADRPIVIVDTSVFVSDALSSGHNGAASQLLALLPAVAHVVTCAEAQDELFEKLEAFDWSRDDVLERYGPIFDAAIWVEPVEEREDHLKAVGQDRDDTMYVRVAEAVYSVAPEIIGEQLRFITSANTRHFKPGANYAGFRFDTPHGVLKRLE